MWRTMGSHYQNLIRLGASRLILLEHRLTSCVQSASANSAVTHGTPTSSRHCTYYEQLQQLDRSCDAFEEHARNVVGEGDDMGWSTANAGKLLSSSNESTQD